MAQIIRTTARLERTSGITADAVVNTWHNVAPLDTPADALAAATAMQAALGTFYGNIDTYYASYMVSPWRFRSYNLSDPEPRAPIFESTGAVGVGASALPAELSVCLSYRGLQSSGVPVARTRGRIYLGPLYASAVGPVATGDVRPAAAMLTAIRTEAKALADALEATYPWGVYSPTEQAFRSVVEVSTDDAFDIQRRRGASPTLRTRLATA